RSSDLAIARCEVLLKQAHTHPQLLEHHQASLAARGEGTASDIATGHAQTHIHVATALAALERYYRELLATSDVTTLRRQRAEELRQAVARAEAEAARETGAQAVEFGEAMRALCRDLLDESAQATAHDPTAPTLFAVRLQAEVLQRRRVELEARIGPAFARVRDDELALMLDEMVSMQSMMNRTERGFQHAWLVIVATGSAAMTCVVFVARRIARSIKAQMQTLAEKNLALATANRRVQETLASLRASETWHDALIETTTDWVWEIDCDLCFCYSSEHVEKLLGYSPEAVCGRSPFDFMTKEEGDRVRRIVESHASTREPFRAVEHSMLHRDGREIIVEATGVPVFDQEGGFRGYRGTATDITKERRSEQRLRSSEERLRTIINSVQAGIMIVDARSREILDANPAALRLFNAERDEVVGQRHDRYAGPRAESVDVPPDSAQAVDCKEDVLRTRTGALVPILKTITPITYEGRDLLVESFVDISEQRQAAEQMELARQAAEDANQTKSEFLANMSHEIRTPMTAILGFADLLREQCDQSEEALSAVDTIRRNGQHLLSIINDILDISKIEAGKMRLEAAPTSIWTVATEVVSLMRVRAQAKGIRLDLIFEGPLPRQIRSDPMRIRQILLNLVGNAIKFTERGSVRLVVREQRRGESHPRLAFDVIDTGIGIAADRLPLLFQPFTQADSSMSRRFGGTGLGLTISSRLAKMLGGDIGVESKLGVGTRFTLVLDPGPLEAAEYVDSLEEALVEDPATALRGSDRTGLIDARLSGRVLIAEDGPDNQRLIAHFLSRAGLETEIAANGRIACEMVSEAEEAGADYDLVLMDMQMPEMDGYAAARALRGRGCRTPIIALTAHAMSDDRDKCLDAGCDDYATKPIDRSALISLIQKYLRRQAA
ncbi:MAG: PAS domain S-box protein, partial [Phycisphaerales bacterium JB038]